MISQEYTNYPARRMAFWREFSYDLYHLVYEIKTRKVEKWVTKDDEAVIDTALSHLKKALNIVMREHAIQINAFIDAQQEPEEF